MYVLRVTPTLGKYSQTHGLPGAGWSVGCHPLASCGACEYFFRRDLCLAGRFYRGLCFVVYFGKKRIKSARAASLSGPLRRAPGQPGKNRGKPSNSHRVTFNLNIHPLGLISFFKASY